MEWRRRRLRCALILFGVILAGGVAIVFSLPKLMIAPMDVAPADVILHSAIEMHSTADEFIVDLYRRGVARKVVCVSSQISWELYPGDFARQHLISLGMPAEDVISVHLPIAPCGAVNLPAIINVMKSNGWKRALWITHPEDSRYAAHVVRKYFGREGLTAAIGYSPQDRDALTQNWWRAHSKVQRFYGEMLNVTLDQFYAECR
jgi:hypothetical protein